MTQVPFFLGILAPALRAVESAMATAWRWGFPAAISVRMFWPTAFRDLDLLSGMSMELRHDNQPGSASRTDIGSPTGGGGSPQFAHTGTAPPATAKRHRR